MGAHDDRDPISGRAISRRSVLAGAAGLGLSLGAFGSTSKALAADTPKRGGNLRVAILGGGSADTLDANLSITQADTARVLGLYQPLRRVRHGGGIKKKLTPMMDKK